MRKKREGMALMLSLCLTTFLFVVGISLLYFVERDSYTSLALEREAKAQVLAMTGMNFARYSLQQQFFAANGAVAEVSVTGPPTCIANATNPFIYDVDGVGLEQFQIWTVNDTAYYPVHSVGILKDRANGNVLARRELASPSAIGGNANFLTMQIMIWDHDLP